MTFRELELPDIYAVPHVVVAKLYRRPFVFAERIKAHSQSIFGFREDPAFRRNAFGGRNQ